MEEKVEQLFRTKSINEIRLHARSIGTDIDAKKKDLRLMVG